ncbi:MurR/RpiR family transcriptional regulator [Pleomorphomonas koreensis]|uniref:MurR/RpiR family transcriptional regulator n=1 Tax=Pleomorphomonas koreensis TaxID=257440 RepID=UPI0003F89468|nr:MurR/RpiR family transcriptional regulator [Pleomorphomonas koreensis]
MRSSADQPDDRTPEKAAFSGYQPLKEEIVRRQKALPKRLFQIAAFALDQPDEIAFGTVSSISKSIGVPPSAVIRFAQHFGFDGFIEMQRLFRDRMRERSSEYAERLQTLGRGADPLDGTGKTLEGFLAAGRQSMESALRSVSREVFSSAVSVLSGGETIYLLARRRSFPIVGYMAYAFGKLGLRCELASSSMGTDGDLLQFAGPRDAAFAVSFSPYAPETVAQAKALRERGVPLVSLTDSPFSPIAAISNVWFEVVETDYSGFRPLSASMVLALALSVAVAERKQWS